MRRREMRVHYRSAKSLPKAEVLNLYRSVRWSAAKKPVHLMRALKRSHSVVTAWVKGSLVGLGNAISDGSLVVYYPHLLLSPEYQARGLPRPLLNPLINPYPRFH